MSIERRYEDDVIGVYEVSMRSQSQRDSYSSVVKYIRSGSSVIGSIQDEDL